MIEWLQTIILAYALPHVCQLFIFKQEVSKTVYIKQSVWEELKNLQWHSLNGELL